MERANADDGTTLEYEVQGSGEPVVFIHGAHVADSFKLLMADAALKDFRLIRYRRRGYASGQAGSTASISQHAADCLALLKILDAVPAHVVGHSSGGVMAIQLALDAPEAVRSLTLLEPALLDVPSGPELLEQLAPTGQMYESGDKAAAVDTFMRVVCGNGYRVAVDAGLPGAMEQAVAVADTFWGVELPAVGSWSFSQEDASRIKQPVFAVLGGNSEAVWPGYGEIQQRLLEWLPQAKPFVLPRATHLLQMENPRDMAEALAGFLH